MHYLDRETYFSLIEALAAAATDFILSPEIKAMIDRERIMLALGEVGDIWPAPYSEPDLMAAA